MPATANPAPTSRGWEVVPYRPEWHAAVFALWRANFGNADAATIARDLGVAAAREPPLFLLATAGDELLGTCVGGSDGHRHWIYYLCVQESARRRGIGLDLLRRVEAGLKAEGARQVTLHIRRGNSVAMRFYAAAGYDHLALTALGRALKD